ncbi:MAG TPA: branched-chain amino acid ABC transporter permease, partial [Petrotogaceae bacterium]|nr:branched-chain amino acid ABC transporter permease [Petrotogaceae bacterium]
MNMKKALIVLIIGVLLGVVFINKSFLLMIFSLVLIYAIAAMGLNIVSGFTGQVSIGHGAFMAVGAYTTAAMAMDFGTPFYINIVVAIVLAAFLGFLIGLPALRLKGFYLAIATMAFGVAVEQLFAAIEHFGGHIGMRNIPRFFESDFYIYLLNLVFFVVLTYVASLILHSPVGEKYKMVRDSEVAARAYGIKPSKIKLNAFIVSAIYGGIAGALYAHTVGYISPPDFGMNTSLNLLSMIV